MGLVERKEEQTWQVCDLRSRNAGDFTPGRGPESSFLCWPHHQMLPGLGEPSAVTSIARISKQTYRAPSEI